VLNRFERFERLTAHPRYVLGALERDEAWIDPRLHPHVRALVDPATGLADTVLASPFARAPDFPKGVRTVSLAEPMFDVFAFVTRRGTVLSPATRVLVRLLEDEKGALGGPL